MEKTLEYYLHLPYLRELVPGPGGAWFARIKDLPGCLSQGSTAEEALRGVEDALAGWIAAKWQAGEAIPEPEEVEWAGGAIRQQSPSGASEQRGPRSGEAPEGEARPDIEQAGWLLKTGRPLEAAGLVKQALDLGLLDGEQQQVWVHQLSQAAVDFYVHGDFPAARELLDRLVLMLPGEPRQAASDGDRLAAEGRLDEAEAFFQQALENEPPGRRGVLYNQLGYIHLIQGRFHQANRELSAALLEDDGKAVLRAAFMVKGALVSGPLPVRPNSIHLVAFTNQAAVCLAQKDLARAGTILKTMQVYEQEVPLTLEVWGCVAWAQGNHAKAREVWNHALRIVQDPREQRMLVDWLEP